MSSQTIAPRAIALHEFEPLVGQILLVDCTPRVAELQLIEAKPLRQPPDSVRIPFSLLFHSSGAILLVSGSYAMRCGDFGPELIFITPVTPPVGAAPGHYYEAIFN
jgi:hypothetical protein